MPRKAQYPTTKAGLLRMVKELEIAVRDEQRKREAAIERAHDLKGDLNSARNARNSLGGKLTSMRVAYSELRGYTVSMIDVMEAGKPDTSEPGCTMCGHGAVSQNILPANFPTMPDAMYPDDQRKNLPF